MTKYVYKLIYFIFLLDLPFINMDILVMTFFITCTIIFYCLSQMTWPLTISLHSIYQKKMIWDLRKSIFRTHRPSPMLMPILVSLVRWWPKWTSPLDLVCYQIIIFFWCHKIIIIISILKTCVAVVSPKLIFSIKTHKLCVAVICHN